MPSAWLGEAIPEAQPAALGIGLVQRSLHAGRDLVVIFPAQVHPQAPPLRVDELPLLLRQPVQHPLEQRLHRFGFRRPRGNGLLQKRQPFARFT